MKDEIRQKILEKIKGRVVSGAEMARLLGAHTKTVGVVLAQLVREGLIRAEMDDAGYPVYSEISSPSPESATDTETTKVEKVRNKPFTPNRIAGAYEYRGNLVIKLHRSASAKSVTLSRKDFQMLAQIYGGL